MVQQQGTAREEAGALDRQIDQVIQITYDTCQTQRKARRPTTDLDPATGDERPSSPLAEDPNA